MSSIYLYIIYISRPWFKGSGAAAGNGSISGISIPLCPFCRYAIVHTNHHFARKRESTAMAILLTFFFNWWENGCVPKGFNQKHAGCRETSGVFCCERGSRFRVVGCGGGFAEILRLRSQLFWHSLSHIRRFSPLRMTKRGNARRSVDRRFSSYRQPSPRGEGAPKGRIGHWRHERERERASQVDDL